ncbi:MAG: HDOD domain-containing protein [Phycisphaerales bacterium JB037]
MARILIIDDSAFVRECLRAVLNNSGFHVRTLSDLDAALEQARKDRPDAIVVEPLKLRRAERTARLRELGQATVGGVVALTAAKSSSAIVSLLEAPIRKVVLKSEFSLDSFRALLGEIVGSIRPDAIEPDQQTEDASESSPESPVPEPRPKEVATASPVPARTRVDKQQCVKRLDPTETRASVEKQLREFARLNSLSPVVSRVLRLIRSKDSNVDDVVSAIQADMAIASGVIATANSSLYLRGAPTTSLRQSVLRIGLDEIREVVARTAVIEKFAEVGEDGLLDPSRFWRHSMAVATMSCEIAGIVRPPVDRGDAYLCGLLHDIGQLALNECVPKAYRRTTEVAAQLHVGTEQVETKLLGLSHADASRIVLEAWGIPAELAEPVALHQSDAAVIEVLSANWKRMAGIVSLSNRLVHAMGIGSAHQSVVRPIDHLLKMLGISGDSIDKLIPKVEQHMREMESLMLAGLPRTDRRRAIEPLRVRVRHVSDHPEADIIRRALESIGARTDQGTPGCIVLSAVDANRLPDLARQAAADKSLEGLPVIVIARSLEQPLPDGLESGVAARLIFPVRDIALRSAIERATSIAPKQPSGSGVARAA